MPENQETGLSDRRFYFFTFNASHNRIMMCCFVFLSGMIVWIARQCRCIFWNSLSPDLGVLWIFAMLKGLFKFLHSEPSWMPQGCTAFIGGLDIWSTGPIIQNILMVFFLSYFVSIFFASSDWAKRHCIAFWTQMQRRRVTFAALPLALLSQSESCGSQNHLIFRSNFVSAFV